MSHPVRAGRHIVFSHTSVSPILLETLEGQKEIQDLCRVYGISQLVILKDTEGGSVKV